MSDLIKEIRDHIEATTPADPPAGMHHRHTFKDIREFYTSVAEHTCSDRKIEVKDEQGTSIFNTYLGFQCKCGEHFLCTLEALKCTLKPMRRYLQPEQRAVVAERLTCEPQVLLAEMRSSGGWNQLKPSDVMALALAAATHPEGNEYERGLNELMAGKPPS